jgi:hypothetical protein
MKNDTPLMAGETSGWAFGSPGDKYPDSDNSEVLGVITALQGAGIPCCIVGTAALIYYGAGRVTDVSCASSSVPAILTLTQDWTICVPNEKLDSASSLLKSEPFSNLYEPCAPRAVQPYSLLHTFPFFKRKGQVLWIQLVLAWDCHFDCAPSNFETDQPGFPYPRLEVLAQSLLDMNDLVGLTDLIDGMDLSEEWGEEHLELDGTNDIVWAQRKNEAIRASVPTSHGSCFLELSEAAINRREIWSNIVRGKAKRIGPELQRELYSTRFRLKNSQVPRLCSNGSIS